MGQNTGWWSQKGPSAVPCMHVRVCGVGEDGELGAQSSHVVVGGWRHRPLMGIEGGRKLRASHLGHER